MYSCGTEEVKAGMESELSPLLPEGTSIQAWAAGLADKEHKKVGKAVLREPLQQEPQGAKSRA